MKILSITPIDLNGAKIIVTVEGYPHAQPVFDAALQAWKKNQDAVDAINAANLAKPPPAKPEVAKELKDKIGTVIADKAEVAPK